MVPVKRHAYEADFKLISYTVEHGNRAAAREFNNNDSMAWKWRKQRERRPNRVSKETKQKFDVFVVEE